MYASHLRIMIKLLIQNTNTIPPLLSRLVSMNDGAGHERKRETKNNRGLCRLRSSPIVISSSMNSYSVWEGWSVSDVSDSHKRRRPQLHTACLIYLTIISLAQTDSASSCGDRCTGSRRVGVSAAPDGPIRKP